MIEGAAYVPEEPTDGRPVGEVMFGSLWSAKDRAKVRAPAPPRLREPKKPRERRATYSNFDRVEGFAALLTAQGGACALCRAITDYRLLVDHCHATGVVRGLLCRRCNAGLGFFLDSPEVLRAAAAYVASFQE